MDLRPETLHDSTSAPLLLPREHYLNPRRILLRSPVTGREKEEVHSCVTVPTVDARFFSWVVVGLDGRGTRT